MSFQLKGVLAIVVLLGIAALVLWSPWSRRSATEMPADVFEPWEGEWQGRRSTYAIGADRKETHREGARFISISADSQIGVVVVFNPDGDTLRQDSLFRFRRGDSLYYVRKDEGGGRELNRGYWSDGQLIWRSEDIFGRVSHSFRERVQKELWETEGFVRNTKGQYRLLTARALKR